MIMAALILDVKLPAAAGREGYGRLGAVLRAVLFDFGGVFTLSPFPVIAEAAPELGLTPEAAIELCFGVYDVDGDHPWHRLERGEISLEQARAELSALAREQEIEIDILALFGRMGKPDPDRETMVEGRSSDPRTGPAHRPRHQQRRRVR